MSHNYRKEEPLIRFRTFEQGSVWEEMDKESKIILITKGQLDISLSMQNSLMISESGLFFLPVGTSLSAKILDKSSVVVITIGENNYPANLNISGMHEQKPDIYSLRMNRVLNAYVRSLQIYEENKVYSNALYTLKVRELIYILRASYSDEELSDFFRSHLANDFHFSEQVYKLSQNTLNVKLLAKSMNYSYSGFNKKFRKVFGTTAYLWLRQRRTNMVYYEIYYTNKSLKQISADNKFCTLSHFNEFCHKNLGKSPSEIRRKGDMDSMHKKRTSVTYIVTEALLR
ncbi:helix-turn-helix domain-containing protein [Dysgonomonas sp. 520]|uniref:helix-turn-helix domain-containing protein n=1 Tax=Dysgonomonas sp. 520 TaxID=2302931 RepID=UPI0013CF9FCF|nr:helix-turn-helix domain-containing protein [Dysgonomonas sp. 520]